MNRRHFLALSIASGFSIAASGEEKEFRVGIIGHTGRGNYGHGLDVMWQQILLGNPFQATAEPSAWKPISSAGIGKPETIGNLAKLVSSHAVAGRDLVAAIREDRAPLCSANDGRGIVEMISAVFESHRLGGTRVTFPLKTRQAPLSLL